MEQQQRKMVNTVDPERILPDFPEDSLARRSTLEDAKNAACSAAQLIDTRARNAACWLLNCIREINRLDQRAPVWKRATVTPPPFRHPVLLAWGHFNYNSAVLVAGGTWVTDTGVTFSVLPSHLWTELPA